MALLDLSLVTKTLVEIVKRYIAVSPAKPAQVVDVTSLPPDQLLQYDNSIGIYLYHLVEEAAFKNQTWPGRPSSPAQFSPIGLNLHYIVSTHSASDKSEGPYREQLLMGLATKALHDYPMVNDGTVVGGFPVMPTEMMGDDNRIRLALRHVPANEAISYWTAGSQPLRLSSYYEVSVVLIEPEEPGPPGGRVLTWGVDAFVGGMPRLTGSRCTIAFTLPTEPTPRTIEVQPAQVGLGDRFTLIGEALGNGSLDLFVRGPGVPEPRRVGAAWGVSASSGEVSAGVQADISGTPTIPGTYAASVEVARTITLANGLPHTDRVMSNETPFQVVPAVSIGAVSATGVFAITGGLFADPNIPIVRTSIGGQQLVPGTYNALNAGEVAVHSATELQARIPAGVPSGAWLPVRVVINGSESAPRWVKAP
jgi:hypothetical protein